MTAGVDAMIDRTIGKEGRFSDHPSDRGGKTMWGITERVARKHGYTGPMHKLPREEAFRIYKKEFFIDPGFAQVAILDEAVAEELFDTGVNMGPAVPALWFQEWLNAFNSQGRHYRDIKEDGDIGPATLNAFSALQAKRGVAKARSLLLKGLNADQAVRYKQLARGRQANEDFIAGWIDNRVE